MRELFKTPWVGPLLALIAVYALFTALSPETFARGLNLVTMLRQTVVVGIAAVGMTLIIVHGGIDLSVGSMVALTTVIVASSLRSGFGPWQAVLAGLCLATLFGFVNGALAAKLRITPFIVTPYSRTSRMPGVLSAGVAGTHCELLPSSYQTNSSPRVLSHHRSPSFGSLGGRSSVVTDALPELRLAITHGRFLPSS